MLGRLSLIGVVAVLVSNGVIYGEEPVKVRDLRGKIVRVDPVKNIVVVRTTNGTTSEDVEYLVDTTTQYWGPDRVVINDGLKYKGFTEGTEVWYRTVPNKKAIAEVRFFDPAVPARPK